MLFSLYVTGIEKIIPGESDIGMFADDITLWCSSPGVNHVESTLSSTLTETDGSKDESNRTGSGAFLEKLSIRLSRHNSENCSVLRSELIAIDAGLRAVSRLIPLGNRFRVFDIFKISKSGSFQ
ncbi:hypothetical protein TNCV_3445021 [Trichonephila clavipes]|nr:hypothetical protein TNCV_3445021 [Trichonephila clavipes]